MASAKRASGVSLPSVAVKFFGWSTRMQFSPAKKVIVNKIRRKMVYAPPKALPLVAITVAWHFYFKF
jgi:hypothetical protein